MGFSPPFSVGTIISNSQLSEVFKVGNMGGMRRSRATNTLVLICDNTKGLYHDQWDNGQLLYTGMGKIGDQVLQGNQNKTLAESNINGVSVHLFEVNIPGKYTYAGEVRLAADPYQDIQPDDNGNKRRVWVFPLEKVNKEQDCLGEKSWHNPSSSKAISDDITRAKAIETDKNVSESERDISKMDPELFKDPLLLLDYLQNSDNKNSTSEQIDDNIVPGMRRRDFDKAPCSKILIGHCFGVYDHDNSNKPYFSVNDAYVNIKDNLMTISLLPDDISDMIRKTKYFTVAPIVIIFKGDEQYLGFSQTINMDMMHTNEKARKVNAPYISFCPIVYECEYIGLEKGRWIREFQAKIVNIQAIEEAINEENEIDIEKVFGVIVDYDVKRFCKER